MVSTAPRVQDRLCAGTDGLLVPTQDPLPPSEHLGLACLLTRLGELQPPLQPLASAHALAPGLPVRASTRCPLRAHRPSEAARAWGGTRSWEKGPMEDSSSFLFPLCPDLLTNFWCFQTCEGERLLLESSSFFPNPLLRKGPEEGRVQCGHASESPEQQPLPGPGGPGQATGAGGAGLPCQRPEKQHLLLRGQRAPCAPAGPLCGWNLLMESQSPAAPTRSRADHHSERCS